MCCCRGSQQFYHLHCLRTWLDINLKTYSHFQTTCYYTSHLQCELCHTPFQHNIRLSSGLVSLVPLSRPPQGPYVVFQAKKAIYLLQLQDQLPVKIGRGTMSEIKINDISVSRLHSKLVYHNN